MEMELVRTMPAVPVWSFPDLRSRTEGEVYFGRELHYLMRISPSIYRFRKATGKFLIRRATALVDFER
jgi:hypothetical protein